MTLSKPTLRLGDRLIAPVYGGLSLGAPPEVILAAGQSIETLEQLDMLRSLGYSVVLPDEDEDAPSAPTGIPDPTPNAGSDFENRVECGSRIRLVVMDASRDLYSRLLEGHRPDYDRLIEVSVEVANEVTADPHAYAALTFLRMCDDYTVEHSADVSILMVAMAQVLEVSGKDLQDVALAGLMHDVGKQLVPQAIIEKKGTLTEGEFAEVRRHPEYGMSILAQVVDCPEPVREVAMQHHERLDGSGYPFGCNGRAVHNYSMLAAAADAFDAMTSNRVYHSGKPARQALKELCAARGQKFDPMAIDALVKLIGAYPVGTRVWLDTGERGVVIAPNYEDSTRPVVEIDTVGLGRRLPNPYRKELGGTSSSIVAVDV